MGSFGSKILFSNLTLRRPNFIGVHVPVAPDLAKTLKVGSDHSENLTSVFDGAKNDIRSENSKISKHHNRYNRSLKFLNAFPWFHKHSTKKCINLKNLPYSI